MGDPQGHDVAHSVPPTLKITVEVRYHPYFDRCCAYAVLEEYDLTARPQLRQSAHCFGETREVAAALAIEQVLLSREYELLF